MTTLILNNNYKNNKYNSNMLSTTATKIGATIIIILNMCTIISKHIQYLRWQYRDIADPDIAPLVQSAVDYLLDKEKSKGCKGTWGGTTNYNKYHSIYCAIVGLTDFSFSTVNILFHSLLFVSFFHLFFFFRMIEIFMKLGWGNKEQSASPKYSLLSPKFKEQFLSPNKEKNLLFLSVY